MEHAGKGAPSQRRQQLLLILGLVLLCAGGGLIMVTVHLLGAWESAILTAALLTGMLFSFFGSWRPTGSIWLFSGFMLIVSSLFLLVMRSAAPAVGLDRVWPFFMIFAGLSIVAAGAMRTKRAKASYLMPAGVFVMLGSLFLPFSLRIAGLSFGEFIKRAWPAFFIGAGAILISLYVGNRIRFSRHGDDPAGKDGDGV